MSVQHVVQECADVCLDLRVPQVEAMASLIVDHVTYLAPRSHHAEDSNAVDSDRERDQDAHSPALPAIFHLLVSN
jgi:hypothetical protein